MGQLDNNHPYGQQALRFAQALAGERFSAAHGMLSTGSRSAISEADLRESYLQMIEYGEGPATLCEVMIVDDSMPKKTPEDRAWVYVAICGLDFSEAVAVCIVDESGESKLRIEDWGRP